LFFSLIVLKPSAWDNIKCMKRSGAAHFRLSLFALRALR
jgi:hypothetical protein